MLQESLDLLHSKYDGKASVRSLLAQAKPGIVDSSYPPKQKYQKP